MKPEYANAYNNRGNAYRETGDLDKAIQDFNTAIDLNTEYAKAYNNRGRVLATPKRMAEGKGRPNDCQGHGS